VTAAQARPRPISATPACSRAPNYARPSRDGGGDGARLLDSRRTKGIWQRATACVLIGPGLRGAVAGHVRAGMSGFDGAMR